MPSANALSNRIRGGAHPLLCALIAVSAAQALVHGQLVWLLGALLLLGATLANAIFPIKSVRRQTTGKVDGGDREGAMSRIVRLPAPPRAMGKRKPGFHAFLMRRLGDPLHQPGRFLYNFFLRPLCAGSFSDFWRFWNPVYGYVLLFFVYPTLRRALPRRAAVYGTFLFSGFVLHDLMFNLPADLSRGQLDIPQVTLLFALYGALTLISEAFGIDFSQRPAWLRIAANLSWLGLGFGLRNLVLMMLRAGSMH